MTIPTSSTPHPKGQPPARRNIFGMLFGLMLFYLAVFAAIDLVGFKFPMPVLITYFFVVAIPFGLFVAGSIYFVYLLRLQFGKRSGSKPATKPGSALLVSSFIGATVVATAGFVTIYPEWKQAAIASWRQTIEEIADPELPKDEVQRLAADVALLAESFSGYFETSDMEGIEANQELIFAFQHVVSAITDRRIDAEEFELLRRVVPARTPVPVTAPSVREDR